MGQIISDREKEKQIFESIIKDIKLSISMGEKVIIMGPKGYRKDITTLKEYDDFMQEFEKEYQRIKQLEQSQLEARSAALLEKSLDLHKQALSLDEGWMKEVHNTMQWEAFKHKYKEQNAKKIETGYGPGAVVLSKSSKA